MKRKMTMGTMLLALTILCGMAAAQQKPLAEAGDLWTYITEENRYQEWKAWPGLEGMYEGQSPHGAYLKLYVNDKAYDAIKSKNELPDGAILVKENYGEDKETLMAITPMYKYKGYNPEAGNWFWAKYGDQGKVMASGKVQSCIDCHMKAKDSEWLFSWDKKMN